MYKYSLTCIIAKIYKKYIKKFYGNDFINEFSNRNKMLEWHVASCFLVGINRVGGLYFYLTL